jgi:hypothetical protein
MEYNGTKVNNDGADDAPRMVDQTANKLQIPLGILFL